MAMRPGSGGVRPGDVVRPVYEEFKPISEWKQEAEKAADILLVYLPGFLKEYIRVATEKRNTIRVRGERQGTGNKWSRFQEDFQVPENCDIRGIHAKLEGGILTITMPWKNVIRQVGPKGEPRTTQEVTTKPTSQQTQKDIPPQDMERPDSKTSVQSPTTQKTTSEPKLQRAQDDTPPKLTSDIIAEKQTDGKSLESLSPQKIASYPKPQKGENETPKKTNGLQLDVEREERIETTGKPSESKVSPKVMDKTAEKEKNIIEKGKEPIEAQNVVQKITEKRDGSPHAYEEKTEYSKAKKAKETTNINTPSGYKQENHKQVVKGLGKGNEERQLMINMCVAVLLIVGLGVYVFYNFGSSGKANN